MEDTKLIAKKRELEGTANVRRLRSAGSLPGVVYGADKDPVSVVVDLHDFEQILHHHTSESLIIAIELEGEGDMSVLVKDVQHHPVTSDLLHVDMMRVEANRPITVDVAIEVAGEAAGVKAGGILDLVMHSISVECLPADLVECFDIDVSKLGIGQSLHVSDLDLGDKYKVLVDGEAIVASITGPQSDSDDEDEGSEPEVIGAKKAE
ncbi:MAG: 50S ribosomal protein L25 [Pontiellaceae bacterium]|nr:50S ribosomal protein L25 [Pontiellaceae bacterium]MBN2786668.1 50S ribosomal protein L25 [Pontiellaceae bacterium]